MKFPITIILLVDCYIKYSTRIIYIYYEVAYVSRLCSTVLRSSMNHHAILKRNPRTSTVLLLPTAFLHLAPSRHSHDRFLVYLIWLLRSHVVAQQGKPKSKLSDCSVSAEGHTTYLREDNCRGWDELTNNRPNPNAQNPQSNCLKRKADGVKMK